MPDRDDVENLLNSYSLAYDTGDTGAMKGYFTEDAVFVMRIPGNNPLTFEGRERILQLVSDALASQTDQRRHVNSNLIVHGTENGVTRTTHYLSLLATESGETRLLSAGVYRIEIVEEGGTLRMRRLDLELDRPY